ncbi:MAG TPA: 50S ribosomal protein L30 [Bacteroidales bacterium]|nr:50S ribosomal protein L30 [Bacteroidales bacterium]
MKKLRIKQVRSGIGRPLRQKRTLEALGFKRMNQVLEVEATPQIAGMVEKVRHLLQIEEIDS